MTFLSEVFNLSELYVASQESFLYRDTINPYYGFNVSRTDEEPIEQIQAFIAASRLRELTGGGFFVPFIAGSFEALNATSVEDVYETLERQEKKELSKRDLFKRIMDAYGLKGPMNGALITQDLWTDPYYWACVGKLFETGMFTYEGLVANTLQFLQPEELEASLKVRDFPRDVLAIDDSILAQVGDWPATIMYTPAEVAEALYLQKKYGVNLKIGPVKERPYDEHISGFMNVLHLRQPTDFLCTEEKPKVVTPYIAKDEEIRISFSDTPESIRRKIAGISTADFVFIHDQKCGSVMNPFVDKAVLAVESAHAMYNVVYLGERLFVGGTHVTAYALNGGLEAVQELKEGLPDLIAENLIKPFI